MSRQPRIRERNLPHHIISRSIPELDLYRSNRDKNIYLKQLVKCAEIYQISIIAYCLMDTHVHLLIHPKGGDISRFMRDLNQRYAKYYNRQYKRRGPLFSERFKNIVVLDENQLFTTSVYIHNNSKDILYKGYKNLVDYPFSSLKDYLRPGDGRGIVDLGYIFAMISQDTQQCIRTYKGWMDIYSKGEDTYIEGIMKPLISVHRNIAKKIFIDESNTHIVIRLVSHVMGEQEPEKRHDKYKRDSHRYKEVLCYLLRLICDLTLKEITQFIYNHCPATIGRLSEQGRRYLMENPILRKQIFRQLVLIG